MDECKYVGMHAFTVYDKRFDQMQYGYNLSKTPCTEYLNCVDKPMKFGPYKQFLKSFCFQDSPQ